MFFPDVQAAMIWNDCLVNHVGVQLDYFEIISHVLGFFEHVQNVFCSDTLFQTPTDCHLEYRAGLVTTSRKEW